MNESLPTERTDDDHTSSDIRQSATREARVSRDGDGEPIGAAVFLTAKELADLGVEPETTDAVKVSVEDGEVRLRPTGSKT